MANAFESISAEYSARADVVARGGWAALDLGLTRWFEVLDRQPEVKAIVDELLRSIDYQMWANTQEQSVQTSGRLNFPATDPECTALRLAMFRAFSFDKRQAMHAARMVFQLRGSGPDEIIPKLLRAHFDPLVGELRSIILQRLPQPAYEPIASGSVTPNVLSWPPGTVDLEGDDAVLIKVRSDLDELIAAMRAQNDVPDPIAHSQVLQEISAGRELLMGRRVEPAMVGRLLDRSLSWVVVQCAGLPQALLGAAALEGLMRLFGMH